MSVRPLDDDGAARLLERLVRTPSPSGRERAAAEAWLESLADLGFACELDAAGNPLARAGDGALHVALIGHVDTVPGEVPVRWEGDDLYGRGTVDAKGCLVAFTAAASRALAAGADLRLTVGACVEEEAPSSRGARHLRAHLPAPDALVIGEPSGWRGVTLGYKGHLAARVEHRADCGHGAHERTSAAEAACAAWEAVRAGAAAYPAAGPGVFDGLLAALHALRTESDGLHERARADLSLRLPLDLPPAAAADWLRARVAEADPGARVLFRSCGVPAFRGARTSPLARALAGSLRARGERVRWQVKTGTADLNLLAPAWGCPAVAYGPGDASLDHTPHEHLSRTELARASEVLADALAHLARDARPGPVTTTGAAASAAAAGAG